MNDIRDQNDTTILYDDPSDLDRRSRSHNVFTGFSEDKLIRRSFDIIYPNLFNPFPQSMLLKKLLFTQYRRPDPICNQTVLVGAAVRMIFYLLISFC